jgi:hypothetical protein
MAMQKYRINNPRIQKSGSNFIFQITGV